jgi:hypothetical protein
MQTLQIYRKPDVIPSDKRFKKIEEELRQVRVRYPMPVSYRHPEKSNEKIDLGEAPKIKSIELQNKLRRIENQLNFWVNEYRELIDDLRELDKLLPKSQHSLSKSDDEASGFVQKVVRIDEMKEKVVEEYRALAIRYDEHEEKAKKQIRKLQEELDESQAKAENFEYELKRLKKQAEKK